jgi:hypothetical protein
LPGPYKKHDKKSKDQNVPKTTAKIIQKRKENLTLHNWMMVFCWMDDHPGISQTEVVKHFQTRAEGVLIFNQTTLSCNLKRRAELEAQVDSNPNALSSKRP